VCVTLAGARSYTAIAEWASDAPPQLRAGLGLPGPVPDLVTIWRVLTAVDPLALDRVIGAWVSARLAASPRRHGQRWRWTARPCAAPGRATGALRICWPAWITPPAWSAPRSLWTARPMRSSCSPWSWIRSLIRPGLVTADAMHAQRGHAIYLHGRGAHYLVTVKGNQPGPRPAQSAVLGRRPGRAHRGRPRPRPRGKTHPQGRHRHRGPGLPHARQAIQITRKTRRPGKTRWRTETACAICSLPAVQAQPAQLATWIRGHWKTGTQLHWVRDVTFGEDLPQARTGTGPHVMASLRNLVISILRLPGSPASPAPCGTQPEAPHARSGSP
jgi:predicted transposase YbfD/YdcC